MDISIEPMTIDAKPVLANLMELYIYDFSEFMGWDIGDDGRFGYRYLDAYWTEANRFPFLIRVNGKIAGFALVSVIADESPPVTSMSEFFVMRNYRRKGVGERAAKELFARFSGPWSVSQVLANLPAQRFWRRVITDVTQGEFTETTDDAHIIQTFVMP